MKKPARGVRMTSQPRIAVVGAGAIGGVTSAYLARAGYDPEVVCKHQETVDLACSQGLHVFGVRGDDRVRVAAVQSIADLTGPKDVVLLATKATDCVNAAQDLLPFLHAETLVVSLQNGICEHAIAEVVGRERIVGCVVGWSATMHGPAELEVTSAGEFVIGNIDHKPDERLPLLRTMLNEVMPTRISENIMGELYSKLIVNSCINALAAITGLTLGPMLAMRKVRAIFIALMREMMAVADAMGIRVEPAGGGKLNYYDYLSSQGLLATWKRHLTIRAIGFKYRRAKPSSLQSLERGRKTEVDYLNGYVCARATEHGVPAPLNDAICRMIKEIEEGTRPISVKNLDDPIFAEYR